MTGTTSDRGLWIWQPAECPWQIEYSPPILDDIRRVAVDAFFSLPRGGAEIGGILFGTHSGAKVRISASRPMECEHAFGPTFVLSDKDRAHLSAQLEEWSADPALRGLCVVGWYHSHTRSEIFLSEQDLEIYREFFPEPWQVALVLRPAGMKPTRAGFFFREPSGAIHSSGSYLEFIAGSQPVPTADAGASKPANGKPPAARLASVPAANAPVVAAPSPVSIPVTPPVTVPIPKEPVKRLEPVEPPPVSAPAVLPSPSAMLTRQEPKPEAAPPAEDDEANAPVEVSAPVEMRQAEFVPPAFLLTPEHRRSRGWLWVLLIVLAGAGLAVYFTSGYWMRLFVHRQLYLHLQALDQSGQLRIQWDRESMAAQSVTGGTLEIIDGPTTTHIPLDVVKLRAGTLQYVRRSAIVEVHLTVRLDDAKPLEEFTSFIGQAPPRASNPEEPQNSELAAQAEKARADLAKEELRRIELEQSLEKMKQALRREDERRRVENQIPATSSAAPSAGAPQPDKASGSAERPFQIAAPPALAPPPGSANKASAAPAPATNGLSGRWVYSPASKTGSPFPPESVSLVMTEANGQVNGVFAGRYRVPRGRKFGPSVKFHFEGAVHPSSSKFPFATTGGTKGEIEVIRLPGKQDAIEVVWYSERDKLTFDDIFFRVP